MMACMRRSRAQSVLFATLENLAQIILTSIPPLPAERQTSAIAFGRATYDRYLKIVGMSLHKESPAAVEPSGVERLDG
jgi:hypothetical protein